jgi:hypothetical protein
VFVVRVTSVIASPLTVKVGLLAELAWIKPVPVTLKVAVGVAVPMPMRPLAVSATNRLLVPAAFWIWKAVVLSTEFWNKAAPVVLTENLVVGLAPD